MCYVRQDREVGDLPYNRNSFADGLSIRRHSSDSCLASKGAISGIIGKCLTVVDLFGVRVGSVFPRI